MGRYGSTAGSLKGALPKALEREDRHRGAVVRIDGDSAGARHPGTV
jgi:hypothetical protein